MIWSFPGNSTLWLVDGWSCMPGLCGSSTKPVAVAMTSGSGTAAMVSQDPKIWVVDDFLPAEFLQMVNSTFDSAQKKCQVVKKPNGREILARNIDFDADELCQEVFQKISELCGISGATCGFTQFMVSEVCASGQDAHVDHVNVDYVGSSRLSFLDLTRQSCSEAEPRRVVPTISIIVSWHVLTHNELGNAGKFLSLCKHLNRN